VSNRDHHHLYELVNPLRYSHISDVVFHMKATLNSDDTVMQQLRRQSTSWFLSWSICYEFLRVSTHRKVYQEPWGVQVARGFIEAVLACAVVSMLSATPKHAAVLQECLQ